MRVTDVLDGKLVDQPHEGAFEYYRQRTIKFALVWPGTGSTCEVLNVNSSSSLYTRKDLLLYIAKYISRIQRGVRGSFFSAIDTCLKLSCTGLGSVLAVGR